MDDERLLDALGVAELDDERRERVQDALRLDAVRERYRSANDPRASEDSRLLWRALRPRWIRDVAREIDAELARFDAIEGRADQDSVDSSVSSDSFVELALAVDPDRRRRIGHAALERAARRRSFVEAALDARDAAAQRIGARDRIALLDAGASVQRGELVDDFERVAMQPLDDAVGSRTQEWKSRPADRADDDESRIAVPGRISLLDRHDSVSAAVIRRAVVEASGAISVAPRLAPSVPATGPAPRWAEPVSIDDGPGLRVGSLPGPAALCRTLDALGRVLRAGFLAPMEPRRGRWLDPTFAHATGAVFRRLALDEAFRAACGLPPDARLASDLRLDAALAPRVAWAYVHHATSGTHEARREAFRERVRRAAGRSCWPAEWSEIVGGDARGTERLRGEMLAILYEERLLTRHGRGWYRERRARDDLRELWDAERQATPDDVATAFGLGTIDGATILERCRP